MRTFNLAGLGNGTLFLKAVLQDKSQNLRGIEKALVLSVPRKKQEGTWVNVPLSHRI